MIDVVKELERVHRELRTGRIPAGEGLAVVLRRVYDAEVQDVWDACTDPERLRRWFLPVTGDLRPGGDYQLQGNAGGKILRCEPPRLLTLSWVFGENPTESDVSEVEVRLAADPGGGTTFELVHTAVPDPEFWGKYGPGAVGVGWDLALLGLGGYLRGESFEEDTFSGSAEGREFARGSARGWGDAHRVSGADADQVAAAVRETTAFYAPEPGAGPAAG
jgi:uncharacterized protein YndB with AHSA1/START domain